MKPTGVKALILAAGTSNRMGTPKQLLRLGDASLLQHVIQNILRFDFSEIIAVIGHEAEEIKRSVQIEDKRFRWVINPEYASGQSTSLRKGIESCCSPNIMVFLGDEPLISEQTVQTVFRFGLEKHSVSTEPYVVRPGFQSVPGHPVFFGNAQKIDFFNLKGDRGAKEIISSLESRHVLPVNDQGILMDVDTPETYEKVKRVWMEQSTKKG
ncbi:MAG TPA: nucleotidyltransferase family protein [Bacillales bacterium]|nr:nucleotidyltransferase family protein [Bacillales bacterium]